MSWLVKILGIPLIKMILNLAIEQIVKYLNKVKKSEFKKNEMKKIKEAYDLTQSNSKNKKKEGVKKFEEIFKDFT